MCDIRLWVNADQMDTVKYFWETLCINIGTILLADVCKEFPVRTMQNTDVTSSAQFSYHTPLGKYPFFEVENVAK